MSEEEDDVESADDDEDDEDDTEEEERDWCPICNGLGEINEHPCSHCNGHGYMPHEEDDCEEPDDMPDDEPPPGWEP
jgi:RecJ-like exonuclease